MKFSGRNSLETGGRGRFVLSILILAWLNVAAQPCLMAMEMAPQKSSISEHTVHSEHSEHMSDAAAANDCDHCPSLLDAQAAPCETGSASDCELFPGYNVDGRYFKLQPKDNSPPLTLLSIASTHDLLRPVTRVSPHRDKRTRFAGDPPLNIQYCVFLK